MKILGKRGEKDYYDYIQGSMGIDEKVIYDRRNSSCLTNFSYSFDFPTEYELYFTKKRFKCDAPKKEINRWSSASFKYRNKSWKHVEKMMEGTIYHLLLEVGYHQFLFEIERYIDENNELNVDVSMVQHKTVDKNNKKSKEPLCLMFRHGWYHGRGDFDLEVKNPILKNTWIPKFISAQDMWNMIYEYISSLNDKEIVDTRTNEQHIESHGFDKKISFRHRK